MESHHGDSSRKRKNRHFDEEAWDCTVCTFKNSPEEFRCEMCQTRKGTSTRKPKLNKQIVEEQSLIARAIIKEKEEEGLRRKREYRLASRNTLGSGCLSSSMQNVDRSSPLLFEVFANGYSVVITEYRSTSGGKSSFSVPDSPALSNASSLLGCTSTPLGASSDQLSPSEQPSSSALSARNNNFSEFQDDFRTVLSDPQATETSDFTDVTNRKLFVGVASKTENSELNQGSSDSMGKISQTSRHNFSISKTDSSPDDSYRDPRFSNCHLNAIGDLKPIMPSISNAAFNNVSHSSSTKSHVSTFRVSKRRLKGRLSVSSVSSNASVPPRWSTDTKSRRRFSSPKSMRNSPLSKSCPSRSLRSHICSKTRQASKVAHASLFQNTDQLRPRSYKRRRVIVSCSARRSACNVKKTQVSANSSFELMAKPPVSSDKLPASRSQSSVSPECNNNGIPVDTHSGKCESISSSQTFGDIMAINPHSRLSPESKNTTALTDSCGALSLEMSAAT